MDPTTTTLSKDEVALRIQENWRAKNPDDAVPEGSSYVDDGLTSLNWLQNLNIMTKLGAPTPPTPPASPLPQFFLKDDDKFGPEERCEKSIEDIDYKTNGSLKPPFSYATLICMAMKANKNKMTLSSIYKWIRENFLYYRNADPSWQNSIRHNLSLNKSFVKVPRSKDEPGKGGFWKLDPNYAKSLVDGVFKKRRSTEKQVNNGFLKKSRKIKSTTHSAENWKQRLPDVVQDTPPGSSGEADSLVHTIGSLTAAPPRGRSPVMNVETIDYNKATPRGQEGMYNIDESIQDDLNVLLNYSYTEMEMLQSSETPVSECQNFLSSQPLILDDDFFPSETNDSPLPSDLDLLPASTADTLHFTDQVSTLFSSDWWSGFQQTQNDLLYLKPSLLNFSSSNPNHLGEGSNILYPPGLCLPASPTCANFDQQMAAPETSNQPWADCKAAIEAAALDLESFNDYDTNRVF
ncbi:forkhead box protein N2-like [Limulus polyphemus]|uniref:Forkhead box protein N2-like n=1 Tax=Limulus polyphemus TaxID=6850 RepID=A0ABM1BTC9_LIMPO|nr:forkhead box protein N2-like [Limulus polyphemus]